MRTQCETLRTQEVTERLLLGLPEAGQRDWYSLCPVFICEVGSALLPPKSRLRRHPIFLVWKHDSARGASSGLASVDKRAFKGKIGAHCTLTFFVQQVLREFSLVLALRSRTLAFSIFLLFLSPEVSSRRLRRCTFLGSPSHRILAFVPTLEHSRIVLLPPFFSEIG